VKNILMRTRILGAVLACVGFAVPGFAQSLGTLNLTGPSSNPPGPQISRVEQINGPVNAALAAKQDYVGPPPTAMLKGVGGVVTAAVPGVDYLAPNGSGAALTGLTWGQVGGTPTTLSGYGITNGLATGNNLSDLPSASTARTNLGLGTMATQSAGAVAVTGGSIAGATVAATTLSAQSATITNTTQASLGSTITVDISQQGTGGGTRWAFFNNTLSPSVTTGNTWEQDNSFATLTGPGTANGEINIMHSYFQVNAGATATQSETMEASNLNLGTIGTFDAFLSAIHNGTTGTATTINGINFNYTNDNTTAGAVSTYAAIACNPMIGSGSAPSGDYCIRNADPNGTIATLGKVVINSLTPPTAWFQVKGPDQSGSTFALSINDSVGNGLLVVNDAGNITASVGNLSLGTPGSIAGSIAFRGATSGYLQLITPNVALASANVILPNAGGTLAEAITGTTGSIGGSALAAGACTSGTATVNGATTAMAISVSPVTYPGDGVYWTAYVSSAGNATVKVCGAIAVTPTASAYNVRVIQ
jgi:hypothetical protein